MPVIVAATVIVLLLAVGIVGVVIVGMEGRGRGRAPRIAATMAKAARHLNGDARQPPRVVRRLMASLPSSR